MFQIVNDSKLNFLCYVLCQIFTTAHNETIRALQFTNYLKKCCGISDQNGNK